MDRNEFAPDNNGAGKLNESEIIGGFLFKTDEEFAKTIEKRVRDLNDPAASMEIWIALQFLFFFTAGSNMRDITALFHLFLTARVTCIQTQILWMFFLRFRAYGHDRIQGFFQQFYIVRVGSGKDDRQRKTLLIRQHTAFCPHFFPGPLDSFQRTPAPAAL